MKQKNYLPAMEKILSFLKSTEDFKDYDRTFLKNIIRDLPKEAFPDEKKAFEKIYLLTKNKIKKLFKNEIQPVINATGIILHTNLGRSPLEEHSLLKITNCLKNYSNLEFDLEHGRRGKRGVTVCELLKYFFNTESSYVVNNGAGAIYLALAALAFKKPVIISRGELVQIGGGFRIPDILKTAQAKLVEVGTTNITKISDYENALEEYSDAVLLKVHQSNYTIEGHTESPSISSLVSLAKNKNVSFVVDAGSGYIKQDFLVHDELDILNLIHQGVDLVTMSGDKMLGGPQAGILLGKKNLLEKIKKHPLARVLRIDKLNLVLLQETLKFFIMQDTQKIPTQKMLDQNLENLSQRLEKLRMTLNKYKIPSVIENQNIPIGGGTSPHAMKERPVLIITTKNAEEIKNKLASEAIPPIIPRIENEKIIFDLLTVNLEDDECILKWISSNQ